MTNDQEFELCQAEMRLECLRLAQERSAVDAEPVVKRARRYAEFVLDQDFDELAPGEIGSFLGIIFVDGGGTI